jgi:hypothetical protein
LYRGKYSTGNGRGPTRDILPDKTRNNCGNSSSDVFLKNFPKANILSISDPTPGLIVLNLIILNALPFFPARICVKKQGLPAKTASAIHIRTNSGNHKINAAKTIVTSNMRLKIILQ